MGTLWMNQGFWQDWGGFGALKVPGGLKRSLVGF